MRSDIVAEPDPHRSPVQSICLASPREEHVYAAVSAELENIWPRVQAELVEAVGESTYHIWLEPLKARGLAHGRLSIEAPREASGWVRERFGRVLRTCAERVLGEELTIDLFPAGSDPSPSGGRLPGEPSPGSAGDLREAIGMLGNPKLTFGQFVIGDCNRLAHAAALTVAEMPAQAYNPLFICGPPGVGKTHLLSSIANLVIAHNPGLTVHATTGEAFTNEFLTALARQRTDVFKARHRHVDVLLVDDVQFLEHKTRTEEEFFHTFNALHDAGRQLVLTSDRPPRDLRALEDRLRERFASGLVADIAPPELATRLAILRKRAKQDGLELADDSPLELIADRVTDNVRSIEGALIRVVAFSSLTTRPLDADLTREVLDKLYSTASPPSRRDPPSIEEIASVTGERFGLTVDQLFSRQRSPTVAWARQVAMYLARELTDHSLPSIGRHFGGRDHTTVLHACRRTVLRIAGDEHAHKVVEELLRSLRTAPPPGNPRRADRIS
jgi:chromosomal replication initiator protein